MFNSIDIEQDESNVLRAAHADGVISPSLPMLDRIDLKVFEVAVDNFKSQKHWQGDPLFAPETSRYIEHHFGASAQIPGNYYLVELARISVPRGSIGYLKSIEQYVQDLLGSFYPTGAEYWGIPYEGDPDCASWRWYLRLVNFDGLEDPRFFHLSPAPFDAENFLPGVGYYDLPMLQDLWYMPHQGGSCLNSVIPGGSSLRFYFCCSPTVRYRWQVLGRLRAYIQSALNAESTLNQRILT